MGVAAMLEQGGPQPSTDANIHEFCSTPGIYTCEERELSPLYHATRARIQTAEERYDPARYHEWPMCQFVFRGAETIERG